MDGTISKIVKIMKKSIITLIIISLILITPSFVFAQGRSADSHRQTQAQIQSKDESYPAQVTIPEQDDLQNIEDDEHNEDEESDKQVKDHPKSVEQRSEVAREHMSVVARMIEELLATQSAKGGIGEQVSQVAREQQQAQEETEEQLNNLKERSGWTRRLIGPNYKAIKNLNLQIERNQERIKKLQQLQTQITGQTDKAQVGSAIQVLTNHSDALKEYLDSEEQTSSLFGWFFKLFAR